VRTAYAGTLTTGIGFALSVFCAVWRRAAEVEKVVDLEQILLNKHKKSDARDPVSDFRGNLLRFERIRALRHFAELSFFVSLTIRVS
jgi:hypothetical protein